MPDLAWLIVLASIAGLVSGITGFGSGLVLMGVLSATMPVADATVISAVVAIVVAAINLYTVRDSVPWREAAWTLVTAMPAIAAGVYLLTVLDADLLRAAVAAMILAGCAIALWRPRGASIGPERRWALLTGLVGGLFGGAIGTSGPPIVLYTLLRGLEKAPAKALMAAFFVAGNAWRITLLVRAEVAETETYLNGALLLIPTLVGQYLGTWLFQRMSTALFRYAAMALLTVTAARLLLTL